MLKRSLAIGIPIGCTMWLVVGVGIHEVTTHSAYLTASIARHACLQLIRTKRIAALLLPNITSRYL
jgi:hypothetical protein